MIRECATYQWDLPHAIERASDELCQCGRATGDALHAPLVIERASAKPTLVVQHGS